MPASIWRRRRPPGAHRAGSSRQERRRQGCVSTQSAGSAEGAGGGAGAPQATPPCRITERVAIQFDLAWSGDFNGLINGEFNDRTVAAVKALQTRNKFKVTGILAPPERAVLATSSKNKQAQVGWAWVEDRVTGATVGLPHEAGAERGADQDRHALELGAGPGAGRNLPHPRARRDALDRVRAAEEGAANRRLEVNLLRPDFFILSGMQGLKKFYVRAAAKDGEVRGITILYDQATEGIMDPVVVAMSSAFAPFAGRPAGGSARRRAARSNTAPASWSARSGAILTDRQVIDGCNVIQVGGYGDANRVAEDGELALLRLYGAPDLTPAALVHEGARAGDLTLVGIADPQAQGGGARSRRSPPA